MEKEVFVITPDGCSFDWGCWNKLKKRFFELAAEKVERYHGDIFIEYNAMQKVIDDAITNNKEIYFIIGFHDCGADSINYKGMECDYIDSLEHRLNAHNARCMEITGNLEDGVNVVIWNWNDNN